MSKKVNPQKGIELIFKADLDNLDRFKDISLYAYKQNKALYERYCTNISTNGVSESKMTVKTDLNTMTLKEISELHSSVCSIL
jgi:hypothetical protein